MNYLQLFKVYNLKLIQKERSMLLFTIISILTTITISLVIPQFNNGNGSYIENNIREINGGDLSVVLRDKGNDDLNKQIEVFKTRGLQVKTSYIGRTYFVKNSNEYISGIVEGDYGLKEDEIILQQGIASTLGVSIGDYVTRDSMGEGIKKYRVKAIEPVAMGVDRDAELSSYGKIQYSSNRNYKDYYRMLFVEGETGENLKEEFIKNVDGYMPITLEDKRKEMAGNSEFQTAILSTLSTVGYILSALAIITTIIMILLKRKRDIAIMRMLSLKINVVKNAMRIELGCWLLIPVLLGGIVSFPIANMLLKYMGIPINTLDKDIILVIMKGILFNGVIFTLLSNIALDVIEGIKAITILREDQEEFKKSIKKIVIKGVMLIPVILIIYSIYVGSIGSILSSIAVILFILFFMGIISLIIKILASIKYRNSAILYGVKSIKGNLFAFTIILISITITLWFIMLGFTMEQNISANLKETFNTALPYNYLAESDDETLLENILKDDKDIKGYNKIYTQEGKVLNELPNPFFKIIGINMVSRENYNNKFNITRGSNLYEGKEGGIIVTDDFLEKNRLQVGNILEIETENKVIKVEIKGAYSSAGINSMAVYMESDNKSGESLYEIRSTTDKFIDKIKNSRIMRLDELADTLTLQLKKFVGIFKVLSLLSIISIILLNINTVNMGNNLESKDKEIIKALGLGKAFIYKSELIKILFIVIVSTGLSIGLYSLIVNLFFTLMFKTSISIGYTTILIIGILAGIVTLISYKGVFREVNRSNYYLLRE